MIRQAHTYLVGALGGVTLIAIAIGVFVALVGAQVFHDWPIADLGSQNQKAVVAPAKALPVSAGTTTGGVAATAGANRARAAAGTGAGTSSKPTRRHGAADPGAVADLTGPATAVEPTSSGGEGTSGADSGSNSSSSPAPSSSPSSSNSGSGSPASGSSGSTGNSGSGLGTVTAPVTATTKPGAAAAVDETVKGVDETVPGGTLEKTGVTEVTENVVNGVAGPESVVGRAVEGVGEAVGGALGAGGH